VRVAAGFASATRPRARLRGGAWIEAPRGLVGPLSACDVAVVAGGVTLHEACALGVPVVCLAVAPLQRRAISAFAARGAVIDAGAPQAANSADRVALGVEALLRNKSLRDRISRRARTLVDGRGAIRVARQIRLLARADRGIARG
jgi:spore coat polysaccharide biosynthesis predicted glycosyltransferase SpsG